MSIAIIVGTGMDALAKTDKCMEVATPYGAAYLAPGTLAGKEVFFLRRHGPALNVPPHLINYHANFWALREAGVTRILATAAVGALKRDLPPGSLAVIGDFIDFTKRRVATIFDQPGSRVVHTDFSVPYCPEISSAFESAASELGVRLARRVVYVCVDGPRYETPAEVRMFVRWGGDVVGMTGVPEVILAREMGMCYGALAILANYASGISDEPLSHEEVVACVTACGPLVCDILERAVSILPDRRACCAPPVR
jgi:5'-methylthioadenosine phosphorylase